MMADVNKLVFSIIKFLKDQTTTGPLSEESIESLEVAIQCLESAYGIDMADESTIAKYQVQRHLLDIFNAQISLEPDTQFSSLSLHEPSAEEKEKAEEFKTKGNEFMKNEKYSDALECYSQALKLDNKNAVYFCNRAAAFSKLNKNSEAIADCKRALQIDPQYSKAYGRMGLAYTSIGDNESALECYRKALELDPDNQSYQNNLEIAEQKLREEAAKAGFGLGPAGGMGMPMDFAQMMSNPALINMAQTMMQNPEMQNMMSNFMQSMSQGGGPGGNLGGEDLGGEPGGGAANLIQMGQQIAQQMQQSNPELVAQLRQQMGRGTDNPSDSSDPSGNNPPK